jgi:prepilin-type N-terminal cleavage/methylation domain-containing protein
MRKIFAHKKRQRRAFTLIEIIATILIITVAVSSFGYVAGAIHQYSMTATMRSSEDAEMLARQSQLAEGGLIPGYSSVDPLLGQGKNAGFVGAAAANVVKTGTATNSAGYSNGSTTPDIINNGTSGANLWTSYATVNLGTGTSATNKRVQGLGATYALGMSVATSLSSGKLEPPTFNTKAPYAGKLTGSPGNNDVLDITSFAFPMLDVLLANPANPPGTSYHYTTGGEGDPADPTIDSPMWSNDTYSALTVPRVIKAVACFDGKTSTVVTRQFVAATTPPSWNFLMDENAEWKALAKGENIELPYANYAAKTYVAKYGFGATADAYVEVRDRADKIVSAYEVQNDPWMDTVLASAMPLIHTEENFAKAVLNPTPKNGHFVESVQNPGDTQQVVNVIFTNKRGEFNGDAAE